MEAKYVQAIKAGIIGGIVVGLCILLSILITAVASWSTALSWIGLLNCCILIVEIVLLCGVGALAARMASASIASLNDALAASAVAGAVAGVIVAIVNVIESILTPFVTRSEIYDVYGTYGNYAPETLSAFGAFGSLCCCGPAVLVVTVILAMIGGAIYALLVLKIK